ncbi:CBS domain-containing protein [Halorussus salinisoli]|uniref:CBS domain-containing protein n=1 Tax=Halorussus salinisoli TaxID=2558242 RepID=UPI0010C1EFDE|nr:CBS domain-containing protein [Halorussus salinisoli]
MDISDAVTTEYVDVNPGTRLGKLRGLFDEDQSLDAIVVRGEGKFDGLVTRKDLVSSHHNPDAKAQSVVRHPPKVSRTEDVRETARLMVENGVKLLPVFEDDAFRAVVTATDLLKAVQENLGALDVSDVYTSELLTVAPDDSLGEVINLVRTHQFTRVPVVDDGETVGMISLYDLVDFTTREVDREQGGNSNATDSFGGGVSKSQGRTHGGWGERSGLAARLLDLPARDVMNTPVATITPDAGLDEALEKMLEHNYSSLVVVPEGFSKPEGIVTETDLLRALTWTEDEQYNVQVFGVDLMDDLTRESVAERIEEIDGKYQKMDLLEANVVFHRHKEKLRGTPLLQATIRLFTNEGLFSGTGEGYGARASFDEAAATVEENALSDKERKSPRSQMEHERERTAELLQWWRVGEVSEE